MTDPLAEAIDLVGGLAQLAEAIGVSPQRLHNWRERGLPRTEWTGETTYAAAIEAQTKGRIKKRQLLARRAAAA